MNRYDNRLRILTEEYETLISRENKRIRSNNGIFERYNMLFWRQPILHSNGDMTLIRKQTLF